jgi:hypothetical protein
VYPASTRRSTLSIHEWDLNDHNFATSASREPGTRPLAEPAPSVPLVLDYQTGSAPPPISAATTSEPLNTEYEPSVTTRTYKSYATYRAPSGFPFREMEDRSVQPHPKRPSITDRPSPNIRPSQSEGSTTAVRFNSCLTTNLVRNYAKIKHDDFAQIQLFVTENPNILQEEATLFRTEAVQAYSIGNQTYGKKCLQQYLILLNLQHLADQKSRARFLSKLRDSKSDARFHFYQAFDSTLKKAQAEIDSASSSCRDPSGVSNTPNPPVPWSSQSGSYASSQGAQTGATFPAKISSTHWEGKASSPGNGPGQNTTPAAPPTRTVLPPTITAYPHQSSRPSPSYPVSTFPGYHPSNTQMLSPHGSLGQFGPTTSATPAEPAGFGGPSVLHAEVSGLSPSARLHLIPENRTIQLNPSGRLNWRYIERHSNFYERGKVFAVLWHENYHEADGKYRRSSSDWISNSFDFDKVSPGKFEEKVYSSIRRMVVIKVGHGFSVCIQINSYGGRGLTKFKNDDPDIKTHSRIYITGTNPQWIEQEPRCPNRDIAVVPTDPSQRLTPASRLCYSRPYTVEHTVKAMDVGRIRELDLQNMLECYKEAQEDH